MRAGGSSTRGSSPRGRVAVAAVLAIVACAIATLSSDAVARGGGASGAFHARGPAPEGSVTVFLGGRFEQYRRVTVGAEGLAESASFLWVYEDPIGLGCSPTVAERPWERTRLVIGPTPVDGSFSVARRLRLGRTGPHTFCGYLGPDSGTATATSFTGRFVETPLLTAKRARRTVKASVRRHEFADQVVENLEQRCRRRSRSKFTCRFSSEFPGYSLRGRGPVQLRRKISYRFRVVVQGETVILTDENEGRFPG